MISEWVIERKDPFFEKIFLGGTLGKLQNAGRVFRPCGDDPLAAGGVFDDQGATCVGPFGFPSHQTGLRPFWTFPGRAPMVRGAMWMGEEAERYARLCVRANRSSSNLFALQGVEMVRTVGCWTHSFCFPCRAGACSRRRDSGEVVVLRAGCLLRYSRKSRLEIVRGFARLRGSVA